MINNQNITLALAATISFLIVIAIYSTSGDGAFLLDDITDIYANDSVLMDEFSWPFLWQAFTNPRTFIRAIPNASFAIDWWRGGGTPRAFIEVNILIHALNAALLCLLTAKIIRHKAPGINPLALAVICILVSTLWATHPIQMSAVNYAVQRMTSMATAFSLLSLLLYLQARLGDFTPPHKALLLTGAALMLALGLLCKEIVIAVPVLAVLLEVGLLRNDATVIRHLRERIALWYALGIGVLILADLISGAGPVSAWLLEEYSIWTFTLIERLLTQPRMMLSYMGQILYPVPGNFSIDWMVKPSISLLTPASTLPAILVCLVWIGTGLWLFVRPNHRLIGALILWLPVTLALESSIIPLDMRFDHRMYLPSIGLALLAGYGLYKLLETKNKKLITGGALMTLLAIGTFTTSTLIRMPSWNSPRIIAEEAVKSSPNNMRMLSFLAKALYDEKRYTEASVYLKQSLKADTPLTLDYIATQILRRTIVVSILLSMQGKDDEALEYYIKALNEDVSKEDAHNKFGNTLYRNDQPAEAIRQYKYTLALNPAHKKAKENLSIVLRNNP